MKRQLIHMLVLVPMLILLTACPGPPPAQESCNFVQNAFNRRVSWARMPIQFYADDSLSWQQVASIQEAMDVWNEQFDQPVFHLLGRTSQLPAPKLNNAGRVIADGYNGIYVVDENLFENTSLKDEQARTSISFRGDFIYEADILIDASEKFYFEEMTLQASDGRVQFKSLMVHELGHVLGLGHIDDEGVNSVMNSKLQFGQLRTQLADIDVDSLACEYQ